MQIPLIIAGLLLLASGSYLDNCRGVLLPVLVSKFHINYSQASWFFIAGNLGAVASTLALIPLTRVFSEIHIARVVLIVASIGLMLGGWVSGFNSLLLFGAFVGSVLALFGALSNLFILRGSSLSSRSRVFCVLHLIYGLTSIVAPFAASKSLQLGYQWYWALIAAIPLLIFIFGFIRWKIPMIKSHAADSVQSARLSGLQRMVVLIFCSYVCGEVLTSMWLVTYLVETYQYSVSQASVYLAGFFFMMALTRAICFFSLKEEREKIVLIICQFLAGVFFIWGSRGNAWALCGVGLLGPFFPLFLSRVSRIFPTQAQSLTLWILGSLQLTLAVAHLCVGRITDRIGVHTAFWLPFAFITLTLILLVFYFRLEKRDSIT